jgi:hypothetical protein
MIQPERFKTALATVREGRLMSIASLERPYPEAIHRAARRLGISAAALASAAAATAVAPAAAGATSGTTTVGASTAGGVVGKTVCSFLVASIVKGTLIGLGITVAIYSGVQLVDSGAPANAPISTSLLANANQLHQRNANERGAAAVQPELREPDPAPTRPQQGAAWPGSTVGAMITEQPRQAVVAPAPGAAATARFEDSESPALLSSQKPTATNAIPSEGPVSAAAGTPRTGATLADPRLAREVASLDRARAFANRGDAAGASHELSHFERSFGYATLRKEAMLVNIDVLLSLGRKAEAITIARQLLAMGAPATHRAKLEALVRNQP